MKGRGFLLFSGYNIRAVVALCRLFAQAKAPFFVVAAGPEDPLLRTDYAAQVFHVRRSKTLCMQEINGIAERLSAEQGIETLILCPTSEFLNQFLLDHQADWAPSLAWAAVDRALYEQVTSKWQLGSELASRGILPMPLAVELAAPSYPLVLKPRLNVSAGRTLYPIFIRNAEEWREVSAVEDLSLYFAQRYLDGQSHYLCFYVSRSGEIEGYAQTNLVQQPGGKSIVLAQARRLEEFPVAPKVMDWLREVGYRGPIMIELMEADGQTYFIEANPRFWGPLQLAFSANPRLLALYLQDTLGLDV